MASPRWSYALNQWRSTYDTFVRAEQHERALKTLAVAGFRAIELACGAGRWEPLGNRQMIELNHGSVAGLREFLGRCGIEAVSSFFLDPGVFLSARTGLPLSAANRADHAEILALGAEYLPMLPELGGDRLIVKAAPAYWRAPDASDALLETLADCWNALGARAAAHGVTVGLHLDCLASVRTPSAIARLLGACDAGSVGLAIDTAEFAIAGLDPLAILQAHAARIVHWQLKDTPYVDELEEYRLPNAELHLLSAGGAREIARWFFELGVAGSRLDFPTLVAAIRASGYAGWLVLESDQSPYPATSALLNAWYVRHRLACEPHA